MSYTAMNADDADFQGAATHLYFNFIIYYLHKHVCCIKAHGCDCHAMWYDRLFNCNTAIIDNMISRLPKYCWYIFVVWFRTHDMSLLYVTGIFREAWKYSSYHRASDICLKFVWFSLVSDDVIFCVRIDVLLYFPLTFSTIHF